ncbi:glycosyltransferase [Cryobacterium sp. M15]|uniref:glycosyltransferase n=1 Tax=Cryobacterium sp. M15 TaxID=2048291 RepID=UPI001304A815|nr:glycosyltransferase [Cryobacterium sp. M15]
MTQSDLAAKGICVMGRSDFHTGIGTVSNAALELFSRVVPVGFYPARNRGAISTDTIHLPGGRVVPITREATNHAVYFFCDVLWNGADDLNYTALPHDGFKIAHMAYDSDEFPPEWVVILNERFDLALFTSRYLEEIAVRSGVRIPVGTLPVGLDIEGLLAEKYIAAHPRRVRFGSVAAFHERKRLDLLVESYIEAFGDRDDVELVIHSNLASGSTFERVQALTAKAPGARITLTYGNLSDAEKNDLLSSMDIYVSTSSGEGYSIGPREALALGKPLVLSGIPAHRDLGGVPGVFFVEPTSRVPARYPEIDNRVFGRQSDFSSSDFAQSMSEARIFTLSPDAKATAAQRKELASQFSLSALAAPYQSLIDRDARAVRPDAPWSTFVHFPDQIDSLVRPAGGRHGQRIGARKVVVQAHDGGFFSLFNAFLSHLVWGLRDSNVSMVIPDWDAGRLIERDGHPESYCYSRPEDGNMWLELFEPLYDLTPDEMNDADFIYANSVLPELRHNEAREPLLTYTNAFELYRAPWFRQFRSQYSRVLQEHVRLIPPLQSERDNFVNTTMGGRFVVAAHVKHPSHSVEQPGGSMAERYQYIDEVRQALTKRGIVESSDDWRVFVATDQDRVVKLFNEEFGDKVIRFDDVARVSVESDIAFDTLSKEERNQSGFQLQHVMAADTSNWSSRLAWEVWRDAEVMAQSDVLIHAVSNVATAVSYMGKNVEMVYCDPKV